VKQKIVIYTTNSGGMPKGPKYQNPEWFDALHKDAAKVIVVGDWPKVVEAYKGLGIPVEVVDHWPIAALVEQKSETKNSSAAIPDNWEQMPWTADDPTQTIRFIAQQFTDAVVINRKHAAKIIRDEIERRAAMNGVAA
jgi:hypothetical protein